MSNLEFDEVILASCIVLQVLVVFGLFLKVLFVS